MKDKQNTHAQEIISSEMVKHKSRNEITNSQKKGARFQQINQTLHTFHDGTKHLTRKDLSSKKHTLEMDTK
jgi:hypothetical protein